MLALDHARDPLTNSMQLVTDPQWSCSFSTDGSRVGAINPRGIVQVWELPSGKPVWSLRSTNEMEAGVVWLPDWSGVAALPSRPA